LEEKLRRLVDMGIDFAPVPGGGKFVLLARGGFAALVGVEGGTLGRVGSTGLAAGSGLAMLVWRGEAAHFVGKGVDQPASPEQVEGLRAFTRDVESALR
jgi:hypothetical protein